ncbi:MAG: VOC family protein [Thermodesulfobacteriota bacterium]
MLKPDFLILYVADPAASAQFYQDLLGKPPVVALPMFAEFDLAGGMKLGLWAKRDAQPAPAAAGGGGELAFTVEGRDAVDAAHAGMLQRGVPVIQSPVDMDFAYTFVLCDPDGHRLRVCAPKPM